MCRICELRDETQGLHEEYDLRFHQFQMELNADRIEQAHDCEKRILEISAKMLNNMREAYTLMKKGGAEFSH